MTQLLVQIPCKDEEENISEVIASIPRKIPGISKVLVLVIDDNSSDSTVQLAVEAGADFVLVKKTQFGLAKSFSLGASFFLNSGCDILVNTDGDNQYFQEKIPDLIEPILANRAEMAVGDRIIGRLKHFSFRKKVLQWIGSRVVAFVSRQRVPDAASGFRAYSKGLVARLNVTTKFSYAMETLIQAGNSGYRIESVSTGARPVSRPSRLFKSNGEHVLKSAQAIVRGLISYRPLLVFSSISTGLLLLGLIPFLRYLVLSGLGQSGEHLQSLILGTVLLLGSFSSAILAILSDFVRSNRLLLEDQIAVDRLARSHDHLEAAKVFFRAQLIKQAELKP